MLINETHNPQQQVLRGNKFNKYTIEEPVDKKYYKGSIWKPEENDVLIGKYVDVLYNAGKFGKPLYILDTDRLDNQYDKVFGCTTLSRQMEKVDKGTVIKIVYQGIKGENNYHDYKVIRLREM